MKPNSTIQLKALFLLTIFSLSTVMSFACSLGLDMGYNSGHHSKNKKQESAHSCCKKPAAGNQESDDKDDCCSNSVINFQLMAKSIVQYNFDFSVPVSPLHHDLMELFLVLNQLCISSEMKQAVFRTSQMHPPDIRVSIRSFQI